jgi:hypothetical protein
MEFYRKYELIEPLPGEGTRAFCAKQTATGREVAVHLLVGGNTPENAALLARVRALPPASAPKLIEIGDNEGTPYGGVVARAGTVSAATGSEEVLESGFVEDPNGSGRRARAGPSARDPAPGPGRARLVHGAVSSARRAAAPSSAGSGEAQTSDAAGG